MTIDENFLAVFEVGLLEIGFGADFKERRIGIVHAAVETVGVLVTRQQILFDTLGTGGSLAEFAERLLSKNGGKAFATDNTRLRLNDFIGKLFRRFGSHGVDHFNGKQPINFYKKQNRTQTPFESMGTTFLSPSGLVLLSDPV